MKTPCWTDKAKWIWLDGYDDTLPDGQLVWFRKQFHLDRKPTEPCQVRVSADTRYRLFVNGISVSFGPCKSYLSRWYFETVNISPNLRQGLNIITARVLRFSNLHPGNLSMMRGPFPGFILHCEVEGQELHTDMTWEARKDTAVEFIPRSEWNYALGPPFMSLSERVDGSLIENDWHMSSAAHWSPVMIMTSKSMMLPVLEPWKLVERPIPVLPEIERKFDTVTSCTGILTFREWNDFIHNRSHVTIAANATVSADFSVAELTTGFLELKCSAGPGALLEVLCAEAYEDEILGGGPGAKRRKGDRTDHVNGKLYGPLDYYLTREGLNQFEPFWFRSFRFVRVTITTKQDPVVLHSFSYRETHYPLSIETTIDTTKELGQMWKISLNTLRNCMHETYEDCPYYEQNQFAMDSRLQMLFTYQISRDDRLARKCMQEFYASRREDGLLESQFPSPGRCVNIPQFSLFWVLMIHDHMRYFGDKQLIKQYIGAVDGILDHFDKRINTSGLVGQFDEESWPFVDWVKEWHGSEGLHSMGIPLAYWSGAATYNSLVYAFTLIHAADLCEFLGRNDTAREYRARATALNEAVNSLCFNGDLYTDGPGSVSCSQHCQIFAILSNTVTGSAAVKLMQRTLQDQTLPRCSYALSFYVLRAAAKTGVYQDSFEKLIEPWKKMMTNNVTTWAEDDVMFRSDCHGWSASPIYEIVGQIFGLTPREPGYQFLRLEPMEGLLSKTSTGTFVTGGGLVKISYTEATGLLVEATYDTILEVVRRGSQQLYHLCKDNPLEVARTTQSSALARSITPDIHTVSSSGACSFRTSKA